MRKRITKVITKMGDGGTTSMGDGSRVSKSSLMIGAIGELDELNSWLGLLSGLKELQDQKKLLISIQNCLFDIGGVLTTNSNVPLDTIHLDSLETETKGLNEKLSDLDNFVLPGGSESSSFIHIARTVCRRTERSLINANELEKIEKSCLIYINRLSDYLFVLARKVNLDLGSKELLWKQE